MSKKVTFLFALMIFGLFFISGCCTSYRLGAKLAREESACTKYECRDRSKSVCMELNQSKAWMKEETTERNYLSSQASDSKKEEPVSCHPHCDHWKKALPDDENANIAGDILLFPFAPLSLFSYPAGYFFTKWSL